MDNANLMIFLAKYKYDSMTRGIIKTIEAFRNNNKFKRTDPMPEAASQGQELFDTSEVT